MLKSFLTQIAGRHVHDVLINSPTFHRIVRQAHDTVKGIKRPEESGPESTAVTGKVKKFIEIYREEFIDNFRRK